MEPKVDKLSARANFSKSVGAGRTINVAAGERRSEAVVNNVFCAASAAETASASRRQPKADRRQAADEIRKLFEFESRSAANQLD